MSRVISSATSGSGAGAGASAPFNPALVIDDASTSTTKTWSSAAWGDGSRDIVINTLEAEELNIKQKLESDDPIADINAAGAANPQVGIRAVSPTGAAPNYQMVYEAARAAWTAGQEGSEKVIALREDAPDEARALVFDSASGELVSKPASANIWYVDAVGSDTNDGQTPESAFLTIAAATAVATSGDTIELSSNTFNESVVLPDGVYMRGDGAALSGSGTVLELGDGSCVWLAGVVASSGRAVNLNKSGGSARCFLNFIGCTGGAEAFRSQQGALDAVVAHITTANGSVVSESNDDRVNLTCSRIEVTGNGHVFRVRQGGAVTCQASEIVCGTGNVFDSNAAASASIDVNCSRLTAANLSDISASVEATLIASLATGGLAETGAGSVTYLVPTGASDDFSVGGTLSASAISSTTDLDIDTSGDLTVAAQSMIFTVDGAASTDVIRFRSGNGASRIWSLFQRSTPSGSDCVAIGVAGVTGDGEATIAAVDSGITAYRPLYIGYTASPLPELNINATTTTVDGDLVIDTGHTLTVDSIETAGDLVIASTVTDLLTRLQATGDVDFWLRADTNNVGESDHPALWLTQDGGAISYRFGSVTGQNYPAIDSVASTVWGTDPLLVVRGGGTVTQSQTGDALPSYSGTPPTAFSVYKDRIESVGSVRATGISFDSGTNTLSDFIDTTTVSLTYSGPCTSASADVHLVRIGPMVHLSFDGTFLAGNSVATQLVTTAISDDFRPAAAQHIAVILDPGTGTSVMGSVIVGADGVLTFYPSPEADASNDFNTAGLIGWNPQTITWNVDS